MAEKRRAVARGLFGGSLVTAEVPARLNPDQGPTRTNCDPSAAYSAAVKRKGCEKYAETVGSPDGSNTPAGCIHWIMADGTEKTAILEGQKAWDVTSDPEVDITGTLSSMTEDAVVTLVPFNDLLIAFPTGMAPAKWDGSGDPFEALSESPASGTCYAAAHMGRIYAAGDPNNTSKVVASALDDPEDWTTSGDAFDFTVNVDDGDIIQGLVSGADTYMGGPLYIFKRNSTYMYRGTGPNDTEAAVERVAHVGLVGPKAFTKFGAYVFFCSYQGIHMLSGGVLTDLDPWVIDTYQDIADKTTIVMGHYRNQIWIAYDSGGDGENDSVLVLDYRRRRWAKYTSANSALKYHAFTNIKDGSLVALNDAGAQLYKLDTGTNDDGETITMTLETPDIDMGRWERQKKFRSAKVFVQKTGDYDVTVSASIDGGASYEAKTAALNLNSATKQVVRLPLSERGDIIRIKAVEATSDSGGLVKILGWAVEAEIMEDTGVGP